MLTYLTRPEYVLQPWQIYRRLRRSSHQPLPGQQILQLPWGNSFTFVPHPDNKVEWSLWMMGIYDLALSETLWRLAEPGEVAIDIGANIGYLTTLLATRVGLRGRVIAFEPNPDIYPILQQNTQIFASVELRSLALSQQQGMANLRIPKRNHGEAALWDDLQLLDPQTTLKTHVVAVDTLDAQWPQRQPIGVLKIDIEGHELAAFKGAERLLQQGLIRDILYEQHEGYPSPASAYLEHQGYTVFRLWKGFWRSLLYPANYPHIHPWEPPNYLATLDPNRAQKRHQARGWQVLQRSRSAAFSNQSF